MRTFVTGMVFMAALAAAVFGVISFGERYLPDLVEAPAVEQPSAPHVLAPYEPSPPAVVDEMVRIAELTKDDVVYDLGSGDGRVVIAAARASGARCVGIEMDGKLVDESRRSAAREKLSRTVRFLEQDIAHAELAEASVVMLFLSPAANAELRPRLLRELEPGSRVVSHCHDMGEWKPDKTAFVENHRVYAWIVPADVNGAWKLALPGSSAEPRLEITQRYQHSLAWIHIGRKTIAVNNMQLRGKTVAFTVSADIGPVTGPTEFMGEVDGDVIAGGFRSAERAGAWNAAKIK